MRPKDYGEKANIIVIKDSDFDISLSLAFKDYLVGENLFFLLSELVVKGNNLKEFFDTSEDYVSISTSPYFLNQVKLLDNFNAYAFITALELTSLSSFGEFYGVSVFNKDISNAKLYPLKSIDKTLKTSMLTDTCLATLIQHEVERTLKYDEVEYFVCGNKDNTLMKDFANKASWDYLNLDADNDFSHSLEFGDQDG
jgi:hypothetical protein